MTLPLSYTDAAEYFEESLMFFSDYQNLYKFPNTNILIENILDEIEINTEDLDVYDDHFDLRTVSNEYLTSFFARLDRLVPKFEEFKEDDQLEFVINAPLSPKKKHEIVYFADQISKICERIKCTTVVDFGSGLGYLDQQLFETTHCRVLGLECNESHYIEAKKRQRKYHLESIENVKYIRHTVTEKSLTNLNEFISDKFPQSNGFCIAGLHACADLTVNAMNMFLNMEDAQSLVIIPCCYHKLELHNGTFKNFPLSNCLKNAHEKLGGSKFLHVPFLRLATQPQIMMSDCKMEDLVFHLLARAVLQLYGWKRNCKLKRKKRKAIRLKSMGNDFETYVKVVATGFFLISNEVKNDQKTRQSETQDSEEFDIDELCSIWRQTVLFSKRAAIFILLQNYLQPVFENFVLYDRLCYLQENGVGNCSFKKILNDKISPRCLSLVAFKNYK